MLGLGLVVGGALALAWVYRVPLISTAVPWALERAGLAPAALTVVAVEADRLEARDLTLADGRLTAERLSVTYAPAGLARGRIERVEIAGPRLDASWSPDTGLDLGPLGAVLGGSGGGGYTPALPVRTVRVTDARLGIDTPWGAVRTLGDVTLDASGAAPELTADLTVSGAGLFATARIDSRPWPDPTVDGTLTVEAEARDRAGLAQGLGGTATLRVDWRDGEVSVTSEALTIRADALDPALTEPWPATLATLAAGPLSLRVESPADGPAPRLSMPLGPDLTPGQPRLDGRVRVETARLSATADAHVTRSDGQIVARLTDVTATADPVPLAGVEGLSVELTSPRLDLRDAQLAGAAHVVANATKLDIAGVLAGPMHLDAGGSVDLSLAGGTITLDDAALEVSEARAADGAWTGPPTLTLALTEEGSHTVSLDLTAGDAPAVTLDAALRPVILGGTAEGRVERVTLAGRWPPSPEAPLRLTAMAPDLRLDPITVTDATADLTLRPEGPTLDVDVRLPRLPGEPTGSSRSGHPLRPLRVTGTVSPDPDEAARLRVDATLGAPFRETVGTVRGWLSRDGRDGRLTLNARPLPLGDDGVQPWHLYSALVDLSTRAGTIGLQGTATWRDGGPLRPDLSVGLVDVEAAYGATRLRNLHGVVRLTGLAPPASPKQELAAAVLDMGLPFTDLVVAYHLDGKGAFVLDSARMHLADGKISTGAAVIPLSGFDRIPLTLTVEGLDLGKLAAMMPVDDLNVSGQVDGKVPLVITPGAVRVDAGRLASVGPGTLRYTGEALPDGMEGVDLARRALENFQYDALSMTVDGDTLDEMAMDVRLEGANEAVLDGYPFQLNFSVSGPLTRLIQEGLQGYTIPQRIVERLESMGLAPGDGSP